MGLASRTTLRRLCSASAAPRPPRRGERPGRRKTVAVLGNNSDPLCTFFLGGPPQSQHRARSRAGRSPDVAVNTAGCRGRQALLSTCPQRDRPPCSRNYVLVLVGPVWAALARSASVLVMAVAFLRSQPKPTGRGRPAVGQSAPIVSRCSKPFGATRITDLIATASRRSRRHRGSTLDIGPRDESYDRRDSPSRDAQP
jgi:hypothetical protein